MYDTTDLYLILDADAQKSNSYRLLASLPVYGFRRVTHYHDSVSRFVEHLQFNTTKLPGMSLAIE